MKLTFLAFILLFILGVVGYGLNIYKLVAETAFQAPYKAEVIRTVGLFPPVGAIAGYVDLGK